MKKQRSKRISKDIEFGSGEIYVTPTFGKVIQITGGTGKWRTFRTLCCITGTTTEYKMDTKYCATLIPFDLFMVRAKRSIEMANWKASAFEKPKDEKIATW